MLLISFLFFAAAIILYYFSGRQLLKAQSLKKINKQELKEYENSIAKAKKHLEYCRAEVQRIYDKQADIIESLTKEQEEKRLELRRTLDNYEQEILKAKENYKQELESSFSEQKTLYEEKILEINNSIESKEKELNSLSNSLRAGREAQLRAEQNENKIKFYKINLSKKDIEDIKQIKAAATAISQPLILDKLIWTVYFQKEVASMCNRILGTKKICGIYKITNLNTKECYIGQSVSVADRWKAHCRQGCEQGGVTANKLYKSIYENGLWNFSFELLEECEKEELNKKEKFWISSYHSDTLGLNSTKGNQ